MRGIDLQKLRAEAFHTVEHRRFVKRHEEQVERYYTMLKIRQFFDDIEKMEPPAERQRKKPGPAKGYIRGGEFTDKQMEIAIASLQKRAR